MTFKADDRTSKKSSRDWTRRHLPVLRDARIEYAIECSRTLALHPGTLPERERLLTAELRGILAVGVSKARKDGGRVRNWRRGFAPLTHPDETSKIGPASGPFIIIAPPTKGGSGCRQFPSLGSQPCFRCFVSTTRALLLGSPTCSPSSRIRGASPSDHRRRTTRPHPRKGKGRARELGVPVETEDLRLRSHAFQASDQPENDRGGSSLTTCKCAGPPGTLPAKSRPASVARLGARAA
jgi:hypothetical protein